jgi:hypothetical protein
LENIFSQVFNHFNAKGLNPLDTQYFLPDERSLSDFLKFINKLSQEVIFVDENLKKNGNWFDFFISNELFLLAEIDSFDLLTIEKEKTKILIAFENTHDIKEKEHLTLQFFYQITQMLKTIDNWYGYSSRFNKQRESTALELELVSAISYRCKDVFWQLNHINNSFEGRLFFNFVPHEFSGLWRDEKVSDHLLPIDIHPKDLNLDYLIKQLVLMHRPVLHTIIRLIERSRFLIKESLEKNANHESQIGLLLSFLQLFKHVQEDINRIPERQLLYYYEQILGQKRRAQISDDAHVYAIVDSEVSEILIPEKSIILAGQNQEGFDLKYQVVQSTIVSNLRLVGLSTLFISRNQAIDPGTNFQTVSGIYSKTINLEDFSESFPALGEEQRFLGDQEKTMEEVDLGFAIASPTLRLKGGERKVSLEFKFLAESYQYFLAMLLSVAKNKQRLPEEIFYQIFKNSVHIEYTSENGWHSLETFEFVPPQDWNTNGFVLRFELSPAEPPVIVYQEDIHGLGYAVNQPILKLIFRSQDTFHPYSFLQFLEMEEVKVEVEVNHLKHLTVHSNYGSLDHSIPFDFLGPSPKMGSYLLIGNDEIFCKQLDELKIGWTFHSLPLTGDIAHYFRGYPYGITNDSFQLSIQALSDFRFMPLDASRADHVSLFEIKDGQVDEKRVLNTIDLTKLDIFPDYEIEEDEIQEKSIDQKTGFIKLELVSPAMGFGFEVYSDVYNKSVTESTNKQIEKPKEGFYLDIPNEPFSPLVKDIYIDYKASSTFHFLGTKSFKNKDDYHENFIQIHPFGKKYLIKNGLVFDKSLMPYFEFQGALFIGLQAPKFPREFSLFFVLGKNDKWSYGEMPQLEWSYLSSDHWKSFNNDNLLFDHTEGLTRSGIISFKSPSDISDQNHVMPGSTYWICCKTKNNADLASKISHVYLNGFLVKGDLQEGIIHPEVLPPFSVQSFENNIPGILEIVQPLSSIRGRAKESSGDFMVRVSETLRHKNRAITKWDIEKILIQKFQWLGLIKVFGNFGYENHVKPGQLTIVGIPKIDNTDSFFLPKMTPGQIKEIEGFLHQAISPFVNFKVINPQYEFILVKGKIKFKSIDTGQLLKTLYNDLLKTICPWFYKDISLVFSNREGKKSEILNFINTRSYVDFITGFSVAHLFMNENGEFLMKDSTQIEDGLDTLQMGTPWSIVVPFYLRNLEIVDKEIYSPAASFDLEDLVLSENFIVSSDEEQNYSLRASSADIAEEEDNDEFQISFKF